MTYTIQDGKLIPLASPLPGLEDSVVSVPPNPEGIVGVLTIDEDGIRGSVRKLVKSADVSAILYDDRLNPVERRGELKKLVAERARDPLKQEYLLQKVVEEYGEDAATQLGTALDGANKIAQIRTGYGFHYMPLG